MRLLNGSALNRNCKHDHAHRASNKFYMLIAYYVIMLYVANAMLLLYMYI